MVISEDVFRESIKSASENLKSIAMQMDNLVLPVPETISISTKKLRDDNYISEKLKGVPAGCFDEMEGADFIYVFKFDSGVTMQTKQEISTALHVARELQNQPDFEGKKDYCKINKESSDCLYVGRSKKIRSRLKSHLDEGSEGVFAMHMLRWINTISIDVVINIYYYRFDGHDNLVIQALEDALWSKFEPMFGRQGAK